MSLMEKGFYEFDAFHLDPTERTLSRQGIPVSLTPKAFETLLCLLRSQGRTVTKDELLKQVWPDTFVEEVNLAVNISAIRKALGESPQQCRFIATIPGRGYRFVAEVRNLSGENGHENWSGAAEHAAVAADSEVRDVHPQVGGGPAALNHKPAAAPVKQNRFRLSIPVAL